MHREAGLVQQRPFPSTSGGQLTAGVTRITSHGHTTVLSWITTRYKIMLPPAYL